MNEIIVTQLWMAGVIAMMILFGLASWIGFIKQNSSVNDDTDKNAANDIPVQPPL